ncbi:MAG: PilZ domain-containing protein [Thermodesulfobacteriota bacterium]
METNAEKRKRLRIHFETQALLHFTTIDTVLEARMKNISMNGIFVETDIAIAIETPCRVEVIITAPNSKITMETEGYIARHDPAGLGVAFKHPMEWFALFSIFEHYGRPSAQSRQTGR